MNRLTIEQERDALYNAARKTGMDAHIEYMERKSDAHTYAEKLMLNAYRKGMPYKSSYLYCDTVDACFYFDHDGRACVSFSAQWCNGAKDLGKPIREAFGYIQNMLDAMTGEAEKWLRGCRDERH
jgi:hypothetical protein